MRVVQSSAPSSRSETSRRARDDRDDDALAIMPPTRAFQRAARRAPRRQTVPLSRHRPSPGSSIVQLGPAPSRRRRRSITTFTSAGRKRHRQRRKDEQAVGRLAQALGLERAERKAEHLRLSSHPVAVCAPRPLTRTAPASASIDLIQTIGARHRGFRQRLERLHLRQERAARKNCGLRRNGPASSVADARRGARYTAAARSERSRRR